MEDEEGQWSTTRLQRAVREREISSRELLELFVRRIDRFDPVVNAVATLDLERATEVAERADEATARGEWWGPLHGLPCSVKDAIETARIRSTGGAVELSEHVPARDAPAVVRLRSAGAIVFAKTNAPLWVWRHPDPQ